MKRNDAIEIFNAAVEAVHPRNIIPKHLQIEDQVLQVADEKIQLHSIGRIFLLSVGKAASAMAFEAEKILGIKIHSGLVVTKYHHSIPLQYFTTIEAGHPLPDENSVKAADAMKRFLRQLTKDDLLLCFISGGASALIGDWKENISLRDAQLFTQLLLQCGAGIHELNTVRKHLCFLKGGQLLQHTNGAAVHSFILSDVSGDELSIIASGLTVADDSTAEDAIGVVKKYDLMDALPLAILHVLLAESEKEKNKTEKAEGKHEEVFGSHAVNTIIGNNKMALHAAATCANKLGYAVVTLNENLQGDAEDEARKFIQYLLQSKTSKPTCFLLGGETTVTVKGTGKGGRNQQFALAALHELIRSNVSEENFPIILAAGTDGTDGPTDAAGAIAGINVFQRMKAASLNAEAYLNNNDAYHFFQQTGGLFITGPTQTNVMDIIIAIVNSS